MGSLFGSLWNDAKQTLGSAVDDGTHLVGDGLNAAGLTGAAQAVDTLGDQAGYQLGADVARSADGRWLFFHSDRTGVMNVYAYELATGALVEVLVDFPPTPLPVYILYSQTRQLSPRLRVFVDWVVERYRDLAEPASGVSPGTR